MHSMQLMVEVVTHCHKFQVGAVNGSILESEDEKEREMVANGCKE